MDVIIGFNYKRIITITCLRSKFPYIAALLFICLPVLADSPKHVAIGVILPLTGPVAEYGIATKNGFELARKEHPQLLENIEFIFDDSQYKSTDALTSFQKLRSSNNVLLTYVWGYGPCQAVAPVAESQKSPLIAASADRSVSAGRRYTLRFNYHIEMIADALLEYVRSHNFKHVLVVKTELAYMDGLIKFMSKKLTTGETIEVVDTFQPDDTNFKTTITKLKAKKFDVLGMFLTGRQASQFYREMKQVNFTPRTIGTDFFDSMQVVRDAKESMTGAIFVAPYVDSAFVARYVMEFGNDVQVAWAADSYEFAVLTGKLLGQQHDPIDAEQVIKRYKSVQEEQGTAARYRFTESPEGSGFDFRVVAREIKADRIENIGSGQ